MTMNLFTYIQNVEMMKLVKMKMNTGWFRLDLKYTGNRHGTIWNVKI